MKGFVILVIVTILLIVGCDQKSDTGSSAQVTELGADGADVPSNHDSMDIAARRPEVEPDSPSGDACPDPDVDYDGVYCPRLDNYLRQSPTFPGGWDCPPVFQMTTCEVPEVCHFQEPE